MYLILKKPEWAEFFFCYSAFPSMAFFLTAEYSACSEYFLDSSAYSFALLKYFRRYADLAFRFSLPLRPIFGLNLDAEKTLIIPKIKAKSLEPDVITDIVNKLVQDVSETLDLENYKNEILRSLNLIQNKQSKNINGPKDLGYGVEEACGHNH
jgi:hypothetical protein